MRLYEKSLTTNNKLAKAKLDQNEGDAGKFNFTPQRFVSKKIEKLYKVDTRETSAQRAERLYNKWADRNEKVADARRKQEGELNQKIKQDQDNLAEKLMKNGAKKQFAKVGHSDRLYEVDPSQKEARMWKLQEKIDKDSGYSFTPNMVSNYKPEPLVDQETPRNDEEAKPKIYELGFEERNREFQRKKQQNI